MAAEGIGKTTVVVTFEHFDLQTAKQEMKLAGQTINARSFKCTDEEWKLIKSSAKMRDLSVQDYVMKAVREELEDSSTQADEPDLITQVARTSFFCAAALSNSLPSELREKYIQSAKAKYPHETVA